MFERIVLSIIVVFMLVLTLKKRDKLTVLLTAGLATGILITWTGIPVIIIIGMIIYMLTALLISIINLSTKGISNLNKTTIILTGIITFVANLFSVMHWPHAAVIRYST